MPYVYKFNIVSIYSSLSLFLLVTERMTTASYYIVLLCSTLKANGTPRVYRMRP